MKYGHGYQTQTLTTTHRGVGAQSGNQRLKNFVWRVCRGCFQTREHLSSRGVHCPIDCALYGNNYEDNIHMLLE